MKFEVFTPGGRLGEPLRSTVSFSTRISSIWISGGTILPGIRAGQARMTAREVRLENRSDIFASGAEITSRDNQLELVALGNPGSINVDNAVLSAKNYIRLDVADRAGGVFVDDGSFTSQTGTAEVTPNCTTVSGTPAAGEISNACN